MPVSRVRPVRLSSRASQPLEGEDLKALLDTLVCAHKTPAFRQADPISIPWRFIDDPIACEMAAFFTAMLSYGQRGLIIQTVSNLITQMDNDPRGFIENFRSKTDHKRFRPFVYRFNRGNDIAFLCQRLQWTYGEYGSLEALFASTASQGESFQERLCAFMDTLIGNAPLATNGLRFMFAHPARGGACKRLHMFLRWVVRQDPEPASQVDLGLWKSALKPSDLMIPVDTHVSKISRQLGLTRRNTDDWKTAEEITERLRAFSPEDPIQYDFALMGYGLEQARMRVKQPKAHR